MNRYMDALSKPVIKNGGCIIKFIGDASLHVHNAPVDDKDHAVNAVTTALEMIKAIEDFNKELQAEGRPPVGMGAGVNTGPTLIGNIGANDRYGYDVLGDSVSTAARLEGQTKAYGVLLIIGPETAELVKHKYDVVELDCIAVKGKTIGLKIFTPAPNNELHDHWLELYYAGEWDKALKLVPQLKNVTPELEHYYDNMSKRLEEGVPADWDGTYHATSK
jgi:adenylate cyclase